MPGTSQKGAGRHRLPEHNPQADADSDMSYADDGAGAGGALKRPSQVSLSVSILSYPKFLIAILLYPNGYPFISVHKTYPNIFSYFSVCTDKSQGENGIIWG
jgi:hypothetical protein